VLLPDSQIHPDTLVMHHDNYVIEVGNSVIAISSTLGNYVIVHTTSWAAPK
jgi:hypothetical protein